MGKLKKNVKDTSRSALIDSLQEEIKHLKSINRHLERELKKQGKPPVSNGSKKRQDALIEEELEDRTEKCIQCGKGSITETILGPRIIKSCTVGCGYREVMKNGKKEEAEES